MTGTFEQLFGPLRGGRQAQEEAIRKIDEFEKADTRRRIADAIGSLEGRRTLEPLEVQRLLTHIEWADETGNRDLGDKACETLVRAGKPVPDRSQTH